MTQELDTLMYKMLSYAKRCMEDGAYASIGEMEAFAKGNRVMFAEAVREFQEQKLLRGVVVRCYHDKPVPVVMGQNVAITLDGVNFLADNSAMRSVAQIIGDTARAAISQAVSRTVLASMGL